MRGGTWFDDTSGFGGTRPRPMSDAEFDSLAAWLDLVDRASDLAIPDADTVGRSVLDAMEDAR